MKFKYFIHKPLLYLAIESENIEIVKMLLENKNIDINSSYI